MTARLLGALVALWIASIASPGAATDLYARHCATCHGATGRGDGPAAGMLGPRPSDFTSGLYKFRSTPTGTLPTVPDLIGTISRGLPGTSMPGYADLLSRADIAELARFVLELAPRGARTAAPISLGAASPRSAEAEARGRRLYARVGCAACHEADGRARQWRPAIEGPALLPPADLSEPWTFRGGSDAASVARRVLTGLDGSTMPSFAGLVTPRDAWDIAYHVASLARRPAWDESDPQAIRTAGAAADPLARGRYLASAMLCTLCHTPVNPETGAYLTDYFLAGGTRITSYPWAAWYSRNLTPDIDTGLGQWTEDEIVTAFTRGIGRDGRRLDPIAMPWPWFSRLTPEDARAIATYLKHLPPAKNAIPKPQHLPVVEAVGGKVLALAGAATPLEFWGGNAAEEPSLRGLPVVSMRRQASAVLIGWSTLGLGIACVGLAWRMRRRRLAAGAWLLAGAAILAAWSLLAVWPPFRLMAPERTVRWLFAGTPSLPADLDARARALAERGQYVAAVTPCGLCHTPNAPLFGVDTRRTLAGGTRMRWHGYGTVVATNLTPHPRDGLRDVSDGALLRALASGMARDGRPMHWQAMPWDVISRWSMEDRHALVAYLRLLPPVPGRAPRPRPPSRDDPAAGTMYFGDAIER